MHFHINLLQILLEKTRNITNLLPQYTVTMATQLPTYAKTVSYIFSPEDQNVCQISWALVKNGRSSLIRKIFTQFFAIICHYHGNMVSGTCEKCVLHIYFPRPMCVPNFMSIGQKTRKQFDLQDFYPIFCHYMPLPWQQFSTRAKNVLHNVSLHKSIVCAKYHEHW